MFIRKRRIKTSEASLDGKLRSKVGVLAVHLLLWSSVPVYTLIGAFIFQLIESDLSEKSQPTVSQHYWNNETISPAQLRRFGQKFSREVQQSRVSNADELQKFLLDSAALVKQRGLELGEVDLEMDVEEKWTFPSAVLFAFTIITTIGRSKFALTVSQENEPK